MNTQSSPTLSTIEILTRAKALIQDPKNWTQGEYARSAEGIPIGERHPRATCFCSMGAIRRVTGSSSNLFYKNLDALRAVEVVTCEPLSEYNDSHTHAEVIAKFNEAIAAAKAAQETQS